jgi:uncharacterized protein YndB with AHSA1/START domain
MSETQVTVEREMAAPAETVWALVSDVTRMGEWSPETVEAVWLGGATGPTVGACFKGKNQRGWHRWSSKCEVVEAEPGKSFAFDVTLGPLKVARWGYRFESTPEGCRVEERWEDHRGAFVKTVGGPATGVADRAAHNRDGMATTLANLAAAAESA